MSYLKHLSVEADLCTSQIETRSGFVSIALEKSRRATPYVAEARSLTLKLKDVTDPLILIEKLDVRAALVAAAGISDIAKSYLARDGENEAIIQFVEQFLLPAGEKFGDEIIYRFLLTRGDTLGGAMRNIVGALAQRKLNSAVAADLKIAGRKFCWLHKSSTKWLQFHSSDEAEVENANGLSWINLKGEERSLVYNIKVPMINKNVDFCLFSKNHSDLVISKTEVIRDPTLYVALGELKGGIDPAGSDEHWKTAKSALHRIRSCFAELKLSPKLIFVGAAIVGSVASEIWKDLNAGTLSNAANLTKPDQISSLCQWLTEV